MKLQLADKFAFVSGSTAGIGFAIAKALAGEGARVIVNGRNADRVQDAVTALQGAVSGARFDSLVADLATVEGVDKAVHQFPEVDILVNNLGVYEPKLFAQITDADWTKIIETNFLSGVRLTRHYLPRMTRREWGRVLFISSESAVNIPVEMIHYGVTKTMQVALARGLAETTAGTAVTVNSVLAGPTRSEGVDKFIDDMARSQHTAPELIEKEFFQNVRPSSLLKRFATTDEVAAMVTFLASPLSSATNGAAIRVEGGVVRSIL